MISAPPQIYHSPTTFWKLIILWQPFFSDPVNRTCFFNVSPLFLRGSKTRDRRVLQPSVIVSWVVLVFCWPGQYPLIEPETAGRWNTM